jgi:hypothetical protein
MEGEPHNAMSALRLMPSKASEVATFSVQIIKAVQNGDANPLEVLVMLRALEAVSETVRDEISDNVLTEAEKHTEKKFNAFGAIVERTEVGTKYAYDTSSDVEWEQLNSEFESLKRRKSERETFLKALKEPMTVVNPDTGEVYTIKPPFKTSKSGVRVYLGNVK